MLPITPEHEAAWDVLVDEAHANAGAITRPITTSERETIDRLGGFADDAGSLELTDSAAKYADLRAVSAQLDRRRAARAQAKPGDPGQMRERF